MIENVAFIQSFTNTNTVVIQHNLGYACCNVRVVIGGMSRTDLITNIELDRADPLNKLTVTLSSAQTGYVQILSVDVLPAYPAMKTALDLARDNGAGTFVPGTMSNYSLWLAQGGSTPIGSSKNIFCLTTVTTTAVAYGTNIIPGDIPANDMKMTLPAGRWIVLFNTSFSASLKGNSVFFKMFTGGVAVDRTERYVYAEEKDVSWQLATMARLDLAVEAQVDVRWMINAGTGSCYSRSFIALRVHPTDF